MVRELRATLARASVETLEPDLVILDEFQRFRHLLDPRKPRRRRARPSPVRLPGRPGAAPVGHAVQAVHLRRGGRAATTTPRLLSTLGFLATGDRRRRRAADPTRLREYRDAVIAGGHDGERDHPAPSDRLLKVMSRAERPVLGEDDMLASTSRRRCLTADDLARVRALHAPASADTVGAPMRHRVLEVGAVLRQLLDGLQARRPAAKTRWRTPTGAERLRPCSPDQLSTASASSASKPVDLGNARLRRLARTPSSQGWWQLLWLPPSLPYLDPGGAYADARRRGHDQAPDLLVLGRHPDRGGASAQLRGERRIGGGHELLAGTRRSTADAWPHLQYRLTRRATRAR